MIVYFYSITNLFMLITIFVNEKPIYLTNSLSEDQVILSKQKDILFLNNEKLVLASIMSQMANPAITAGIILGKNFTSVKKEFFNLFVQIEAAGGIVQNENKELLFIYRRSKWDLPKGKLEAGETIETCAAREIEEETGVANLSLIRKVGETFHIYTEKSVDILKTSHWFYFTTTFKADTIAQTEEDITEVKWVKTQQIKEPMANTYENIKSIMRIFFDTP
jgi:8-oxo-dGTP pyrophosphatase MutT (NUDIX family)